MSSRTLQEEYMQITADSEDAPVFKFLNSLDGNKKYDYLEVGAGTGRFPILVKQRYRNISLKCLEISDNLSKILIKNGLGTTNGSVLNIPFRDETFDIVHCSHLIEHFGYPDIIKVLDELFRVVKQQGYVIIRTPLMHPNFYNDIDHIRPYPLKTLMQYFSNEQQQTTPRYMVKLISYWNRHWAIEFSRFSFLNKLLKKIWIMINWPKSKATGYVAFFQKL